MAEDQETREQFPVNFVDAHAEPVDGEPAIKVIMFTQPSEGQLSLIARGVRKAKRGGPDAVDGIGLILDVIDKLVVDPADRNWLEDGLMDTTVDLDDFIAVLDGVNVGDEQASKPHPVTPSRARSGRR